MYYYFVDMLGSTRVITNSTGATCFDADHYPGVYPERSRRSGERAYVNTCPQNYKFTGYERDPETGLDYAFFRYYNSRLGRFMSPDPLGGSVSNPQSLNRYAYVGNNPLSFTDPTGLKRALLGLGGGGFGGLNPAFFYFGYYIWVGGSFGGPFSSLSFTLNLATSDLLSSESASGGGSSSSAGSLLGGLIGANFLDDSGSSIAASPGDTGNPSGSCVYLNDSGTGVESVDQNSSVSECGATGGTFAPGTANASQVSVDSSGAVTIQPAQQQVQCSRATQVAGALGAAGAINRLGAILTAGTPPVSVIFGTIATVEWLGAGALSVYAAYVCSQ